LAFQSAFDITSLGLTVSSILIGAATFVLGFYLTERARGLPSAKLKFLKYLVLSMVIPSYLIVSGILSFLSFEVVDPTTMFLIICASASLVPSVAITIALAKSWG